MSNIPTLTTDRLFLRPLVSQDAGEITHLLQSPEIAANGLGIPQPYQLTDAEHMLERVAKAIENNHFTWAITLRNNGKIIGIITLIVTAYHHRAEIGYWVGKDYWNLGYATEAAQALIKDAFERYELNRLYAKSFAGNDASVRVLEKLGMKYEGLLRQHLWHELHNEHKDTYVYSILKSELNE